MDRILIAIVISCLIISGCSHERVDKDGIATSMNNESDEVKYIQYQEEDDLFRVSLYIQEGPFTPDDKIDIFSTVEYVGDGASITIWSGEPYLKYMIVDDEETYFSEGIQFDILKSTELNKGEVYSFPFQKSGGFSNDQADADFWREYYSDPDLKLPTGTYHITTFIDCSLRENGNDYKNEVVAEFDVLAELP